MNLQKAKIHHNGSYYGIGLKNSEGVYVSNSYTFLFNIDSVHKIRCKLSPTTERNTPKNRLRINCKIR